MMHGFMAVELFEALAFGRDLRRAEDFLRAGGDVNSNRAGFTLLMDAAHRGNLEGVKFLVAHNAALQQVNHNDSNRNALDYAVRFEQRDVAEFLRSIMPPKIAEENGNLVANAVVSEGDPVMVVAAKQRNAPLVDFLLTMPSIVDPFQRGADGRTAIEVALELENFRIVKTLYTADPEKSDAAAPGMKDRVLKLALKHADAQTHDESDFVAQLLNRGADFSSLANMTTLHDALFRAVVAHPRKDFEAQRLADINRAAAERWLLRAVADDNWFAAGLLASGGAAPELLSGATRLMTRLFVAAATCRHVSANALKRLVTFGADLAALTSEEKRDINLGFMVALSAGRDDIATYLLDSNVVDVNARRSDGATVLHVAAVSHSTPSLIIRLLREGADRTAVDGEDRLPWRVAAACSTVDDTIVEMLNPSSPIPNLLK